MTSPAVLSGCVAWFDDTIHDIPLHRPEALAKTIEEFYKIRGKVRAYSETVEKSLKDHTVEHPFPIFSWLNAHDWLIYVPLHTIRHSRQIIEVQEDKNYPKE